MLLINIFVILGGSSFIELPSKLKSKKSLLNIQNNDNKCLKWVLIAAKLRERGDCKNLYRTSKLSRYEDLIDDTGVNYPATFKVYYIVITRQNFKYCRM